MELQQIISNLATLNLNILMEEPPTFNFMDDALAKDIFENNLDIYEPKESERYLELGVPNLYCKNYFDDEDFIYARLKISYPIENEINLDVINYISINNIIIDFSENTLDTRKIYAKTLYLYQYVNSFYSSLRTMRYIQRIEHMPQDLLIWIENIVSTMRYILDNNLFNYKTSSNGADCNGEDSNGEDSNGEDYCNELIYGLNLTICHLKMLLNHYRVLGIPIYNMEEKHIKKMFRVLNNMCIIIIYLRNTL